MSVIVMTNLCLRLEKTLIRHLTEMNTILEGEIKKYKEGNEAKEKNKDGEKTK